MTTITGNLVDGQIVEAGAFDAIEVRNPADGRIVVGRVPSMSAAEVEAVMAAAQRGADVWRRTSSIARGEVLSAAARLIRDANERLAQLITAEMGKTLAEARVEATKAADFLEYYAMFGRLPFGELLPDARPDTYARVIHEPLGVVVLITPWNDPLLTPARKIAPALIAGNAVVIKPATAAPLIVLEFAKLLNEAGLPAGVLGTVTGQTSEVAAPMLEHSSVRAVSFTGSTSVGQQLARQLAGRPIRVQTEMGGKNAVAVLKDADLDLAASLIVAGAFAQAGQRCTATSRVVVDKAVSGELVRRIVDGARALNVGPGVDPSTSMGPVVSPAAQREILEHIAKALDDRANVLMGGTEPPEGVSQNGAFVSPTVLQVSQDARIWREEVFGPVLAILEVDGEAEAIQAVNDSMYGLSASVFTRDLGAAERFIAGVDTGQVSVNQPTAGWDVHHPFGGFRESGSPFKEQGLEALRFYTRTKTVAVRG